MQSGLPGSQDLSFQSHSTCLSLVNGPSAQLETVGKGISGDVWMMLKESASRYPEDTGFISCKTLVYQARTAVFAKEDAEKSTTWASGAWVR